jgi:hypothetical protein
VTEQKFETFELYKALRVEAEEIRSLLNGYIYWLKTQKIGETEPGVLLHIKEIPVEYSVE